MAISCACDFGLGNTGRPNCVSIAGVTYSIILTPTFDDSGVKNFIDTTVPLNAAFFTALINGSTDTRIFPFPSMLNVEDIRGESLTESFNNGSVVKTGVGTRTFKALMLKLSPAFFGKIESYGCSNISAYAVDVNGALIGNGSEVGKLYPLRLDEETWDPIFMKPTDTTVTKIELNYSYSRTENDSDLAMIESSEIASDVDLRELSGLQDVTVVITNDATTGFTATLTGDYGSAVAANTIKGLILGDFSLNETFPTPAPEPFSVDESADGVYDFTYTTPVASADVLALDLTKDGFEMTTAVITTP